LNPFASLLLSIGVWLIRGKPAVFVVQFMQSYNAREFTVQSMLIPYRRTAILLTGATFLVAPAIVLMAFVLNDETEYENWEQSRSHSREVFWMSEPLLHRWKAFACVRN
jgi:hypothetical protein